VDPSSIPPTVTTHDFDEKFTAAPHNVVSPD
jgi:hypothetical protein